jgi:putative transcriptional regulator
MKSLGRLALLLVATWLAAGSALAQGRGDAPDDAIMLLATPQVSDPVFGQTVLLTAPLKEGARIGVILNRPTGHAMEALFPTNQVLGKIKDTVYFGGPMLPEVMVALVRSQSNPGAGALRVGDGLFLAISAPLIEKVLKETPHSARCFVGSVIWQAGELDDQISDGVWAVVKPDTEIIFSKTPESLWESLTDKSRQMTALLSLDQ